MSICAQYSAGTLVFLDLCCCAPFNIRPQLFKSWIVLSIGQMITIQWINNCAIHWIEFYLVTVVQKLDSGIRWINLYLMDNAIGFQILIHRVVIYPVDSAIQLLNNRGLVDGVIHLLNNWAPVE